MPRWCWRVVDPLVADLRQVESWTQTVGPERMRERRRQTTRSRCRPVRLPSSVGEPSDRSSSGVASVDDAETVAVYGEGGACRTLGAHLEPASARLPGFCRGSRLVTPGWSGYNHSLGHYVSCSTGVRDTPARRASRSQTATHRRRRESIVRRRPRGFSLTDTTERLSVSNPR